jgi:hypothetical protein
MFKLIKTNIQNFINSLYNFNLGNDAIIDNNTLIFSIELNNTYYNTYINTYYNTYYNTYINRNNCNKWMHDTML